MLSQQANTNKNPYEKANFVSKSLFAWIFPIFVKGWKRDLCIDDLYDVSPQNRTSFLFEELKKCWEAEFKRASTATREPSLKRALMNFMLIPFIWSTLFFFINHCVLAIIQPLILRELLETLGENPVNSTTAICYATVLSATVLLQTLTTHLATFKILVLAMKVRVALSSFAFGQRLCQREDDSSKASSGSLINILSNDLSKFDVYLNSVPLLFVAPVQFAIVVFLLYKEIDLAIIVIVLFVVAAVPLQSLAGKYAARFRLKLAKSADIRGNLLMEVIQAIELIKQYVWEKPFKIKVFETRRKEIDAVKRRGMLRAMMDAFLTFAPRLVQYLTIMVYNFLGNNSMPTSKLFFVLSCLQLLVQTTTHYIPQAATGLGEIYVTIKRVQTIIGTHRSKLGAFVSHVFEKSNSINEEIIYQSKSFGEGYPEIHLHNISATCGDGHSGLILDSINLKVTANQLVMVVGSVGSSKSTLLRAIMKDINLKFGNHSVKGTISYVSQDPWIFAGTIRENIIFGNSFEETKYSKVLKMCALEDDLNNLSDGDLSYTGERGSRLSGGQKSRISLARAVYMKSQIFILDDPFSSLDSGVSETIFNQCIREFLGQTIRVMVTSGSKFLNYADHIIYLENGRIVAQGSYKDLDKIENSKFQLNLKSESIDLVHTNEEIVNENLIHAEPTPVPGLEKTYRQLISLKTYMRYLLFSGSHFQIISIFFLMLIAQAVATYNDFWVANINNTSSKLVETGKTNASKEIGKAAEIEDMEESQSYILVYTGFALSLTIFTLGKSIWFYRFSAKLGESIHKKMFEALISSPLEFFLTTPSGRIMNRFSKDIGTIDELLPPALFGTVNIILQVLGVFVIVIISNYYLSALVAVMLFLLYGIRKVFIKAAGDLKRIELAGL